MRYSSKWIVGVLLAGLMPLAAHAQIKPSPSPTDTRAVTVPNTPVRRDPPADSEIVPTTNERIRQQLGSHPIRSKSSSVIPTVAKPVAPLRVYDNQGRVLTGMKAAGSNRVLDTGTGRYYDTVPSGDGQRVVH